MSAIEALKRRYRGPEPDWQLPTALAQARERGLNVQIGFDPKEKKFVWDIEITQNRRGVEFGLLGVYDALDRDVQAFRVWAFPWLRCTDYLARWVLHLYWQWRVVPAIQEDERASEALENRQGRDWRPLEAARREACKLHDERRAEYHQLCRKLQKFQY